MGLNDESNNEIGEGVIDNDLVIGPNIADVTGNTKTPITIVAQDKSNAEEAHPLNQGQLQQLLSMDVAFQTVKDGVARVTELEDIESDIIAKESISRSDATVVNEVFNNILGNGVVLEEFTHSPSKTNYSFVTRQMRNRIATEQQNVLANFQLFIDQPLEDATQVIAQLTNNYLPAIKDSIFELSAFSIGKSELIKANKNEVIPYDGDFVNFATVAIQTFDINKTPLAIDKAHIATVINNLVQCFECKILKSFVYGTIEGKELAFILSNEGKLAYMDKVVSLIDLVDFYATNTINDRIDQLVANVTEHLKTLESIQADSDEKKSQYEGVNKFIIDSDSKIMNMHKSLMDLTGLVTTLNHLTLNSREIIELMVKL